VPLPFINMGSLFTTHTDTCSRLSLIVTEKEPLRMQLHGGQSIPHKTGKIQSQGMGDTAWPPGISIFPKDAEIY
jgi:hypothetical protein